MDYKEKYEQALEVAQRFYNNSVAITKKGLEDIFPELAGSEDERIRKRIIDLIKEVVEDDSYHVYRFDEMIAWLEKQGEKKSFARYKVGDTIYYDSFGRLVSFTIANIVEDGTDNPMYEDKDGNSVFQNDIVEQKPIDKVEPKFKVGDKIKLAKEPKYPAREIIAIKNDAYYFDELVHLPLRFQDEWELVEQKPADKVESSAFKDKLLELFQKFRYIKEGVPTNGDIIDYVDAHIQELIDTVQNKPWSEEDYNMLDELLDYCEHSIAYNGKGTLQANVWEQRKNWLKSLKDRVQPQPRQEWSEEDDRMYSRIVSFIPQHLTAESYTACINWLKSLKDRVQPRQEWSEEDEQVMSTIMKEGDLKPSERIWLKSLKDRVQPKQEWSEEDRRHIEKLILNVNAKEFPDEVDWLISLHEKIAPPYWDKEDEEMLNQAIQEIEYALNDKNIAFSGREPVLLWLKHLRPQSQWKPSKEQIVALRWILNNFPYDSHKEEISGLLEQLKKLRGE